MNSENPDNVSRRKFMRAGLAGAGVVAVGATAGWYAIGNRQREGYTKQDSALANAIGQYGRIDPDLIHFEEAARFQTGMREARRFAVGGEGSIYVVGDRELRVFGGDGQFVATAALDDEPISIHVSKSGPVFLGFKKSIAICDDAGKVLKNGESLGEQAYITSIAGVGDAIFLADAGNREIIRCDIDGRPLSRFGKKTSANPGQGFVVPSPYFDVCVDDEGRLHAANPGRHRMETYTLEGELLRTWGSPSIAIEGFCGCCNPARFTLLSNGGFVTSEKGLNRIKIYDNQGRFEGVVAGPQQLIEDPEAALRACADCRVGFALDVAADSQGRVFALDPCTQEVRLFVRKSTESHSDAPA